MITDNNYNYFGRYSYFDNFTNATEVTLELTFAHDIVDGPSYVRIALCSPLYSLTTPLTHTQVTLHGGNKSTVVLYGLGAGRTLVSLTCPNNTDNDTCPFSESVESTLIVYTLLYTEHLVENTLYWLSVRWPLYILYHSTLSSPSLAGSTLLHGPSPSTLR